jgi:uncharacterized membrane protein YdjX (TVP38/TMEM64 family)
VALAYIGLALVPVVLLIAATGIAFGPVLGPIYAMAGCLASGSVGFVIGRWLGQRRVEELGGERVARVTRTLKRNGTLAVFFLRKIPLPFTLANIVVGASTVSYGDFVLGTVLGMTGLVVGLAGFGYQLTMVLRSPSPVTVAARAAVRQRAADGGVADQPLAASGEAGGMRARASRVRATPERADAIVQPGKNCWRLERAHQFLLHPGRG